jgi:hypothetical protein
LFIYFLDFSSFSLNFIYSKIYEFIQEKVNSFSNFTNDKKKFEENKLIKMIKKLGPGFKKFIQVKETMQKMHILEILNPNPVFYFI